MNSIQERFYKGIDRFKKEIQDLPSLAIKLLVGIVIALCILLTWPLSDEVDMEFRIEADTPPWIESIDVTPAIPDRTINLNASCIARDNDTLTITVNFTWWKMSNSTWQHITIYDSQVSCTNNTLCYPSVLVPSSDTELGQDFKCMAVANASGVVGTPKNSTAEEVRWYVDEDTSMGVQSEEKFNLSLITDVLTISYSGSALTFDLVNNATGIIIEGTTITGDCVGDSDSDLDEGASWAANATKTIDFTACNAKSAGDSFSTKLAITFNQSTSVDYFEEINISGIVEHSSSLVQTEYNCSDSEGKGCVILNFTDDLEVNCNFFLISKGGSTSTRALKLTNVNNTLIKNCYINISAQFSPIGVTFSSSFNNTLDGFVIDNQHYGGIQGLTNNIIRNSFINTDSEWAIDVGAAPTPPYQTRIINTTITGAYGGISSDHETQIINCTLSGDICLFMGGNDNLVLSTNFSSCSTAIDAERFATTGLRVIDSTMSSAIDLYSPTELLLLNTTCSTINFHGENSNLTREWYLEDHINQTDGTNVSGATVVCYDNTAAQILSTTTDASGNIPTQNVTEYTENLTGKFYATNLTCDATAPGFTKSSINFNLSNQWKNQVIDPIQVSLISIDGQGNNAFITNQLPYVEFNVTCPTVSTFSCDVCIDDICNFGSNLTVFNATNTKITITPPISSDLVKIRVNCSPMTPGLDNPYWKYQENSSELAAPPSYLYVNYTKDRVSDLSVWQVKHGFDGSDPLYYNISLPSTCWDYSATKLVLRLWSDDYHSRPACYNGTGWENIGTYSNGGSWTGNTDGNFNQEGRMTDGNWTTEAIYFQNAWATGPTLNLRYGAIFEEAMYWWFTNITSIGGSNVSEEWTMKIGINVTSPIDKSFYWDRTPNLKFSVDYVDPTNWTYQETANATSSEGDWNNVGNVYDGTWSTYGDAVDQGNTGTIYFNYSKPSTATNSSVLQIKDGDGITNLTINKTCWQETKLQFAVRSDHYMTQKNVDWYCYNGTTWVIMREIEGTDYVYEEAMWWHIPNVTAGGNASDKCYVSVEGGSNITLMYVSSGSYDNDSFYTEPLTVGSRNLTVTCDSVANLSAKRTVYINQISAYDQNISPSSTYCNSFIFPAGGGTNDTYYVELPCASYNVTLDINITGYESGGNWSANLSLNSVFDLSWSGNFSSTNWTSLGNLIETNLSGSTSTCKYYLNFSADSAGNITFCITTNHSFQTKHFNPLAELSGGIPYFYFFPSQRDSKNVSAHGQNSTNPVLNITNTNTSICDLMLKTNASIPGINLKCATSSNISTALNLTNNYLPMLRNMSVGNNTKLWCWADYYNPAALPKEYEIWIDAWSWD